jgi:aspartyl-tRNA(Asn)/glutamyl-tRNA(Gln) amidotransferase subunit A
VKENVDEFLQLPIRELARRFRSRELSPLELTQSLLERTQAHDARLRSYITVCADTALEAARQAERELRSGDDRGPLHGVPVAHKDNLWTRSVRTTAHSRTLLEFVPEDDATAVERLAGAGMVLLGKTNTTEFACGDLHLFGDTPNPWDTSSFSGASSGGSASALAAGLALAATGSDTGGSIRAPASFCGVVGVKPTYGRVSRFGLVPLSPTMDHVGPMARTVADAALLLGAMSGHDPRDPSSARQPVPDFAAGLEPELGGLVLGVPEGHFYKGLEPAVDGAVREALRVLEGLGARLEPVSLPLAGELSAAASVVTMSEAFGQHAGRLRERAADYGPKARRRIAAGAFYSAADYQEALQVRALWLHQLGGVFASVDALLTPTLPFTAFPTELQHSGPPDTSWGTRQFNLSGHPAMTLPCGFEAGGLPIGLQVIARPFDERTMFQVGHAFEQATPWHRRRPSLEALHA